VYEKYGNVTFRFAHFIRLNSTVHNFVVPQQRDRCTFSRVTQASAELAVLRARPRVVCLVTSSRHGPTTPRGPTSDARRCRLVRMVEHARAIRRVSLAGNSGRLVSSGPAVRDFRWHSFRHARVHARTQQVRTHARTHARTMTSVIPCGYDVAAT